MKTVFKTLGLLILLALAAFFGYLFLGEEEVRDTFSFIPGDFVYVVESDRPVQDWKELSDSQVWKYLKTNAYFEEITESADMLDSLLKTNQFLVKFIKLGDLVISAHLKGKSDYEFLFMVDLKGLSKVRKVGVGITALFESLDYELTTDKYFGHTLYSLKDPTSGLVLSLSTLDNMMVGSYDLSLLKKSIMQTEQPNVLDNPDFFKVRDGIGRDELYSLYLNYSVFEGFLKLYTDEVPEMLSGLDQILSFSSFDFEANDERVSLKGLTKQKDSVASFLNVFKDIGKGRVLAQEVLPMNTATFTSVGFDDFSDLYNRFDAFYQKQDPKDYKEFASNKKTIESLLGIDIQEDFFSWMTDEIITAIIPLNEAETQYGNFAFLHFDDYQKAKAKMDFLAEQVKKRTPAKFKEVDHNGTPIRYLELKGFFKLFFKRMFSKIEQPHYALVGDYVVFSNDETSLAYVIDSYIGQQTLEYDTAYGDFFDAFENKSNVFTYINNAHFFNHLRANLDYESRVDIFKNQKYLKSFPRMGFQLYPGGGMYNTYLYAEFMPIQD